MNELKELLSALNSLEIDKDGDGFVCKEAMPLLIKAIEKGRLAIK